MVPISLCSVSALVIRTHIALKLSSRLNEVLRSAISAARLYTPVDRSILSSSFSTSIIMPISPIISAKSSLLILGIISCSRIPVKVTIRKSITVHFLFPLINFQLRSMVHSTITKYAKESAYIIISPLPRITSPLLSTLYTKCVRGLVKPIASIKNTGS